MVLEQTCRAIVEAAAVAKLRHIHLPFWSLWLPLVALSAADPQWGRGAFAILAIVCMVVQLVLTVACAVTFRRFLTPAELWLSWIPGLAMTGVVALMVIIRMSAMAAEVPEAVFQVASAGVKGLAWVAIVGAYVAYIVAGRALRRLRVTTGDDQFIDWGIWLMFAIYIPLGAGILNPMLRRALATEKP